MSTVDTAQITSLSPEEILTLHRLGGSQRDAPREEIREAVSYVIVVLGGAARIHEIEKILSFVYAPPTVRDVLLNMSIDGDVIRHSKEEGKEGWYVLV